MKTKKFPVVINSAAVLMAGIIFAIAADMANAQTLDPTTGMPVFRTRGTAHVDPASGLPPAGSMNVNPLTGLLATNQDGLSDDASGDENKIGEVQYEIDNGWFDDALKHCLAYQSQPKTEQHSQMLFSAWAELGRHYPPAEQTLREIRDEDTRHLSGAGGGSLVLFDEVTSLNRDLQDEGATCGLFKQIWKQNPPLAFYYYPVAEDLLMSHGEYQVCLNCTGDPQARFDSCWSALESSISAHQRLEEYGKNYQPPLVMPNMLSGATNTFVRQVCNLVEILVATGNKAAAEKIRDQAVARLDDPRLSSAVSTAEENIKKHGVVSSPTAGLPQYAGDHLLAENGLVLACGMPTETIRTLSPFAQVPIWTAKGQYDQALRVIQDLCDYLPSFSPVSVVLPNWMELARIYPPAKQSMIEIRDRDTREFEQAKDSVNFKDVVSGFMEVNLLNNALGESNATHEMCLHLEQHNPAQFQECFYLMEPLLMQRGDYQLCLKYLGDPQANFEMLRTNLEFMRKVLPLQRENQTNSRRIEEEALNKARQFTEEQTDQRQQFEQGLQTQRQQFRQEMWTKMRTNTPDAETWPLSPPPNYLPFRANTSPRYVPNIHLPPVIDEGLVVTNSFVGRVCVMVDILVAAGHKTDAEKIRDQAVTLLDDPRLQSAVSDAEEKIHPKPVQTQN